MRPLDCGDRGENDARWCVWRDVCLSVLDEITAEWLRGVDAEAVRCALERPPPS